MSMIAHLIDSTSHKHHAEVVSATKAHGFDIVPWTLKQVQGDETGHCKP